MEDRDNAAAGQAVAELEAHRDAHQDLATDLAKYEGSASGPETVAPDTDRKTKPTKRTGRARKTAK